MMDKRINHTTGQHLPDDTDSEYLGTNDSAPQLDFGELFSNEFTNIQPIYSSVNGPIEIYTATRYGKRFILKGLKEQYRNDPIYTMNLAKEFEIGIQLDHPNIRRTIGLESVEGIGKVIVLEYVDGCMLESLLDPKYMTSSAARSIATQIADALRYIHSKQIFHRDLKPSNILVSHQGGVVKIIDFNLSDSNDFIILKNPAGSRKYMAPEQLNPSARPTAVADIYSFGVVIDELAAVCGDEPLSQLAEKCRKQNPRKRPQSVSMLRIPGSSVTDRFSRFLSSKTLTGILLCVIAALAAIITFLLIANA